MTQRAARIHVRRSARRDWCPALRRLVLVCLWSLLIGWGQAYSEPYLAVRGGYKCSQCHNNQPVSIANAAKTAHGRIALDHGSPEKPLACFTCHDRESRDLLVTEGGERVDMDHSYQLCGQCHFRQKKDWVGGAHGKRITYWAGERVVQSCASCHDPHSPHFKKRWPVTYSSPTAK